MLAQMLETAHQRHSNCTLLVTAGDHRGIIHMVNGELIAAENTYVTGPTAAYDIITWHAAKVEVQALQSPVQANIGVTVSHLVLEAVRVQQEWDEEIVDAPTATQTDTPHSPLHTTTQSKEQTMSDVKNMLERAMQIDGAIAVALVDWNSGMTLGTMGSGINIELAAAGNTNVVRSKLKVMRDLGLKDRIEDMLITLGSQYHLIRLLESQPNLFIYLALNKTNANLGMARYQLSQLERELVV